MQTESSSDRSGEKLERLYRQYNRRAYVHPDPLEFLYAYPDLRDREIVGLIASSLAYGRVAQILKSVGSVLNIMGPCPSDFLKAASPESLKEAYSDFRHRFADGENLAALLTGAKQVIGRYGSLHDCFLEGMNTTDTTVLPALSFFARKIAEGSAFRCGHLIPLPERGSACKRLNLFLRWMVRKDAVDPGGWDHIPLSGLIVPLDVHLHRISLRLGMTARKQADMKTALEVTSGFKKVSPDDPVRYDFALTRLGIRKDADPDDFFRQ